MNEPTMETLARRLDRVERENRWLKQAGVVALAVIAAVVLMGQATGGKVAKVIEEEKREELMMDSSTAVGLIVGLFTVSGTLGATFLSNMFQLRREREQAARDASSERNLWLRDEKKRIYISLLGATMEIIQQEEPGKATTLNVETMLRLGGYSQQLSIFGMEGAAEELSRDLDAILSEISDQRPALDADSFGRFNKKIMTMARKDLGVDG